MSNESQYVFRELSIEDLPSWLATRAVCFPEDTPLLLVTAPDGASPASETFGKHFSGHWTRSCGLVVTRRRTLGERDHTLS